MTDNNTLVTELFTTTTTATTISRTLSKNDISDQITWTWLSFIIQTFTGIYIMGTLLWYIYVTRGNSYFTKRSISDCHTHVILFCSLGFLFCFTSLISYLIFGSSHYINFGLFFVIDGIYCGLMVIGLFVLKYRFQVRCRLMVKENRELGTPITEREAADLCRIKDYYEKTRKSTNWQRPVFTREQLEAWARYLAIADLTGEKQQALQQIVGEMRRGPLNWGSNWGPTYFQNLSHPVPAIQNFVDPVPPAYCP